MLQFRMQAEQDLGLVEHRRDLDALASSAKAKSKPAKKKREPLEPSRRSSRAPSKPASSAESSAAAAVGSSSIAASFYQELDSDGLWARLSPSTKAQMHRLCAVPKEPGVGKNYSHATPVPPRNCHWCVLFSA